MPLPQDVAMVGGLEVISQVFMKPKITFLSACLMLVGLGQDVLASTFGTGRS
ncbi:hypothetical protein [Peribacillus saganii]|uniref:hypothetical protein n=1 Tax=Peribacillus saganii TaxID=2303992 RepID=UPI00131496BA|nr:hypothetical protein [Peribacillus saganii]